MKHTYYGCSCCCRAVQEGTSESGGDQLQRTGNGSKLLVCVQCELFVQHQIRCSPSGTNNVTACFLYVDFQKLVEDPERFVQGFLEARVGHKKLKGGLLGKLRVQTMLLDPTYKAPKVVTPHRPPKKLSARTKRAMKLYEIPKEKQK